MTSRLEQGQSTEAASPRVLIVEDERTIARDLKRDLSHLGCVTVGVASTAESAVAMAQELHPDLVLMGLDLTEASGPDAASVIQERLHIPVVYATAGKNESGATRAKPAGRYRYLVEKDLEAALEAGLERRGPEQEVRETRRKLEIQEQRQASIIALGAQALSGSDTDSLFATAVPMVARDLGVELASIFELLPGGKRLLLRAGVGWPEGLVGTASADAGPRSLPGYTLQVREPVVTSDVPHETRWQPWQAALDLGVQSALSVFMGVGQQKFGALLVATRERREFTQPDIHYLRTIANVLTTAMERKATEANLLEHAARLHEQVKILESIQDGVIVTGSEGRIQFWNEGARLLFGYSSDEVVGKTPALLYPNEDEDRFKADLRSVLERKVVVLESQAVRKDGTEVFLEVKIQALEDGQGRPTKTLAVARDITHRKRLERAIAELSVPVTEIRQGMLLLPLVGEMDEQRAGLMSQRVLQNVREHRARVVVIDATGLSSVDARVIDSLIRTAKAARVLGARAILTGISAAMARTISELATDLGGIRTVGDLRGGIEEGELLLLQGK